MIKDALFGLAVGDALGVPVEFKSRDDLKENPVTDMIGYGTHNVPPGTWSDDSSLSFCLAEALHFELNLNLIGENFVKWLYAGFWTATGKVFDVGNSTQAAIEKIKNGISPALAGGFSEDDNGNGSLMRILPLVFAIKNGHVLERYEATKAVSSITHSHIRSVLSCFYYLEFARLIAYGEDKISTYIKMQNFISMILEQLEIATNEIKLFDRLLKNNIHELPEREIFSTGYVLHTLEASIWSLLTTENYADAVLQAVNLGGDTDTTGAVTGGLAGLLYGFDNIPIRWIENLARRKDIEQLSVGLAAKFEN
jgi:ADP-ribosyl-[dinitrogen reductase] hydrolase